MHSSVFSNVVSLNLFVKTESLTGAKPKESRIVFKSCASYTQQLHHSRDRTLKGKAFV